MQFQFKALWEIRKGKKERGNDSERTATNKIKKHLGLLDCNMSELIIVYIG